MMGAQWIQKMLAMDKEDPTCLTDWDKQALMTMIDVRDEKERLALEAATAKLRPDPEEELPDPESF